jgi:hypothetical protein
MVIPLKVIGWNADDFEGFVVSVVQTNLFSRIIPEIVVLALFGSNTTISERI